MYIPIHVLQYIVWVLPMDIRIRLKSPSKKIHRNVLDIIRSKLVSSPTIRIAVSGTAEIPINSMEIVFIRKNMMGTKESLVHFSIYRLTCGDFQYYCSDYASVSQQFINVMVQPLAKLKFPLIKHEPPFTFFIYRFYD